jgi:hypothetical protein
LLILKTIKIFKKYYQSIVVMWQRMFSMPVMRTVWRRALDSSKVTVTILKGQINCEVFYLRKCFCCHRHYLSPTNCCKYRENKCVRCENFVALLVLWITFLYGDGRVNHSHDQATFTVVPPKFWCKPPDRVKVLHYSLFTLLLSQRVTHISQTCICLTNSTCDFIIVVFSSLNLFKNKWHKHSRTQPWRK